MVEITYSFLFVLISCLWILVRIRYWKKNGGISWKREIQLLLVYICVIVVARFTFFPFSKVDGKIQPLIFDAARAFPPRINLIPILYLFDYEIRREAMINFIGNTAMFLPLGIVWPSVFRKLDTPVKVILSGVATSLAIEILQLPFFDRVSDVDDLILNSLGFITGYGIYLLVKTIARTIRK